MRPAFRLPWMAVLAGFVAAVPGVSAPRVRAEEPAPFSITRVEFQGVEAGGIVEIAGHASLPGNTSLLGSVWFEDVERTECWQRGYVGPDGGYRIKIGPISKRMLPGPYRLEVSCDPSAQDISVEPFLKGWKEIRRTSLEWRLGTIEEEQEARAGFILRRREGLDEIETLAREIVDLEAGVRAGARCFGGKPPRLDAEAFLKEIERYRGSRAELERRHQEELDSIFAPYYPAASTFQIPHLFKLLDILTYHLWVPEFARQKVPLPDWLVRIRTECGQIPILPPARTVKEEIGSELRRLRGVFIRGREAAPLREFAWSRDDVLSLLKAPEAGALAGWRLEDPPKELGAAGIPEFPLFLDGEAMRATGVLEAVTMSRISSDGVVAVHRFDLVEGSPPKESASTPARLRLLAVECDTSARAGKMEQALRIPSSERGCALVQRQATIVVRVALEGPPDRIPAWQVLNTVVLRRLRR